jgi:hypothetical protein
MEARLLCRSKSSHAGAMETVQTADAPKTGNRINKKVIFLIWQLRIEKGCVLK